MKRIKLPFTFLCIIVLSAVQLGFGQANTFEVSSFDKVIVSPHIEVIFRSGEKESVVVEMLGEPIEKLNVEVKNKTLQLYLDGAQFVTTHDKNTVTGYGSVPLYDGTIVKAVVTYKDADKFSLRGEERFLFEDIVQMSKLTMNIYGESQVYMNEVILKDLKVTIYGESFLRIDKGSIENQKFTAYGEATVNTIDVNNNSTKITAYGDGTFQCNVSGRLKVVAYGEPVITYKGDPVLDSGLKIGEVSLVKVE
ncbi:head GIN domain-containing protein [Mangrovimonas sp. DI 80]|uniref:head GIN domain-containing protein n=1 Tax=Mangrovimonas sp. DI 80 TaxID=1779330 RepID=UPI000977274C|nr:head GIN domain-containing protein [Mangrovimonas sp. DI 80]OMP30914.1 hypothetical protein BKM32_11890 [Mangrovimonas sp. DI 80]